MLTYHTTQGQSIGKVRCTYVMCSDRRAPVFNSPRQRNPQHSGESLMTFHTLPISAVAD